MIVISDNLSLNEGEVVFDFIASSGPGGQNVNKVATAAQLRFDIPASSLPAPVKQRLIAMAGKRVSGEGVLIITARAHRGQGQNRKEALDRLVELIRAALVRPKRRRATKPSYGAKQNRLKAKRKQGETKARRRARPSED